MCRDLLWVTACVCICVCVCVRVCCMRCVCVQIIFLLSCLVPRVSCSSVQPPSSHTQHTHSQASRASRASRSSRASRASRARAPRTRLPTPRSQRRSHPRSALNPPPPPSSPSLPLPRGKSSSAPRGWQAWGTRRSSSRGHLKKPTPQEAGSPPPSTSLRWARQ